jgi:ATP-dependent Clp protease protease subunit
MTPKLLKLLAENRGKGQFKAEATPEKATIYLYDVIVADDYWGGVSALAFAKALNDITAPNIDLRINSPGGDVFAARAIAQAIAEKDSIITCYIDGVCASAATLPVIAASASYITDGGLFMIHRAWTMAFGNKNDLLEIADLLERTDNSIAQTYAQKTGKNAEEMLVLMDAETYLYGQEAVDMGFITAINDKNNQKNQIDWNFSAYKNQPKPPDNEQKVLQANQNRLRLMQSLLNPSSKAA